MEFEESYPCVKINHLRKWQVGMQAESKFPVLLVERGNLGRHLVESALHNLGFFEIQVTGDPAEALRLLDATPPPRLMICGLMLPEAADSIELVGQVRRYHPSQRLPILMMSPSTSLGNVEAAIRAGVDDYIFTPVFPDVLEARLHKLLRRPVNINLRIGEFLVQKHLITTEQLETALRYQRMYSSEHLPISVLAFYLGFLEEVEINRIYLEGRLEDEAFLSRAQQLGLTAKRADQLRALKTARRLRIGDVLVNLRFVRREVLENAMRTFP